MKKLKVYIGGPAVFMVDHVFEYFRHVMEVCDQLDFEALIPYNPTLLQSDQIYDYNQRLLLQADGMIADVDPFRGSEPDSGTVWEAATVRSLGKPVVAYYRDDRTVALKAKAQFGIDWQQQVKVLPDNMMVENWGFPLNLMLYKGCEPHHGDYVSALRRLKELFQ